MNEKERTSFLTEFPLSKGTDALRDACRKLMGDRDAVTAKIETLMHDTDGDVEAVSKRIGELQTQRQLVENRLARKRAELREAVLVDLRAHDKVYLKAIHDGRGRLARGKEKWEQVTTSLFGENGGQRVAGDSTLEPPSVQSLRSELHEARQRYGRLTNVLLRVDPTIPRALATPIYGTAPGGDGWFYANLAEVILELKD